MNRLQKKCLIATAGTHLLAIVLLFCSGFISSKPKLDETQLLDVIPENVVEAALNSGVPNPPKPPPLTLITKPPEPPQPDPKPPTPPVKPADPVEPVTPPDQTHGDEPVPMRPTPKPPKHTIEIDLKHPMVRNAPKVNTPKTTVVDTTAADEAREKKRLEKALAARAARVASLTEKLENSLSTSTKVEMPGEASVSFASYASVVKSIYEAKWRAPDDAASDDANTKVSVTIARDGRVIESHIVNPSGDARVDASVRRTLSNVDFIREFPDGAKESQKIFIINFNLKSKRMNG